MRSKLLLIAFAVLVAVPLVAPASADTFNVAGTFDPDPTYGLTATLSGTIDINVVTGVVNTADLTVPSIVIDGATDSGTFSYPTPFYSAFDKFQCVSNTGCNLFFYGSAILGGGQELDLDITFQNGAGVITGGYFEDSAGGTNPICSDLPCSTEVALQGGSLSEPGVTPLPPSLLTFVTGLAVMSLLGLRRKRKAISI